MCEKMCEDIENQRRLENKEERGEIEGYWGYKFMEIGKFPEVRPSWRSWVWGRQYGGL